MDEFNNNQNSYNDNYGGNTNSNYESNNPYTNNYGGNTNNSYQNNNDSYKPYRSPYMPNYSQPSTSAGEWILHLIVLSIPIVGIIYAVIKMMSADEESLRNFFKAQVILYAIAFVLGIIAYMIGFGSLLSLRNYY